MDTLINLEETLGITVGRRCPAVDPLNPATHSKANAEQWRKALGKGVIPKGVYRFNSHEEANEWLWTTISRKKN